MKRLFYPLLAICIVLGACEIPDRYYIVGSGQEKKEMLQLFSLLEEGEKQGEDTFIIIQQIAVRLHKAGENGKMNLFLSDYVEKHPEDLYNSYYLLLVAQNYLEEEAYPFAAHYFERILGNYPDMLLQDTSVHLICLQELKVIEQTPEYRVEHYIDLISRFGEEIDIGQTYYELAGIYEQLGEWEQAIQAYSHFLKSPETEIPGERNAYREVEDFVEFYNSDKNWTIENLDELLGIIRNAIRRRDSRTLTRYKAKVNFFAMSWEQEYSDENSQVIFDLGTFLRKSNVGTSASLDITSNAEEAYLRTWGWSYRIRTWYLYFRKVRYPADPEINGRWEWAGIYFGEKL
jgi:tetratricopeptide (TPR) repeat protein